MSTKNPLDNSNDVQVEVIGYITDPQRVGYQILTNYESTYWRGLVGNEAWSLYEVLRSFCHEGNNTCRPSIKLLRTILGFKDKRAITGRIKRVNGKEYRYPGYIEVLQKHELVIAEVKGEEPQIRYVYHVNLTPGLLTEEQLDELPKVLQQKHDELLKRVKETIKSHREFEGKRKPSIQSKQKDSDKEESQTEQPPEEGGGNFPPEQHPFNNTHLTTTEEGNNSKDKDNNNSSDNSNKKVVVVALSNLGISKHVSKRLANRYSQERIFEKIDYLNFLEETDPEKIRNPRGWLRTAIEENYGPPDGYKTKEQREAEAAVEKQRIREIEKTLEERENRQPPKSWKEWLTDELNIANDLKEMTTKLQQSLKLQMPEMTYNAWVSNLMIIEADEDQARLAVPSMAASDWLSNRYHAQFSESLENITGHPVEVDFEVIKRNDAADED